LSNALDFVYEAWPLAQAIASHGYIVFQPNYRGSDNLGNKYMLAIVNDTAEGPGKDIMAGLTALEKQPYVDSDRLAVSGWSYGGLLTTWLIGHYQIWRAAVSGAAVNDETEEYNLSISNVQNRYYLGTSPYAGNGAQIYAEQSPITYYRSIRTPTLIWGTTQDPVVPISVVVRALSRPDRQPRSGTLSRLSGGNPRSVESRAEGRSYALLAGVARYAPAQLDRRLSLTASDLLAEALKRA
jgi:dipeptidyl aminopeptidase/acylaminoacyl peptidase